jgi:hypothetical protein
MLSTMYSLYDFEDEYLFSRYCKITEIVSSSRNGSNFVTACRHRRPSLRLHCTTSTSTPVSGTRFWTFTVRNHPFDRVAAPGPSPSSDLAVTTAAFHREPSFPFRRHSSTSPVGTDSIMEPRFGWRIHRKPQQRFGWRGSPFG